MIRCLPVLLLAGCPTNDPADEPLPEPFECEVVDTRTYDTAADPALYDVADPGMGISNQDVRDAFLGSFVGTYSPEDGSAPISIDVAMSVDGLISVQDFVRSDTGEPEEISCPSIWSAPLVFAMSSEQIDGAYVIDDLWSPTLELRSLETASLTGQKPAAEFDGTLPVSGLVEIAGTNDANRWTGQLVADFEVLGTWSVDPE